MITSQKCFIFCLKHSFCLLRYKRCSHRVSFNAVQLDIIVKLKQETRKKGKVLAWKYKNVISYCELV